MLEVFTGYFPEQITVKIAMMHLAAPGSPTTRSTDAD
jgi:hypothetical protein